MRTASADPYPHDTLSSPQADLNADAMRRETLKTDVITVCRVLAIGLLAVMVPTILLTLAQTSIKASMNIDATLAQAEALRGM